MPKAWTNDEIDFLFANYGKMDAQEIADAIGKKKHCIIRMASRNKLKSGRYFTEEEKEYIDKSIGRYSYHHIANKLGRSYDAIKNYTCKNYCNNIHDAKFFTMAEAGRLVGISRATIRQTWILSHGLKRKIAGKNSFIEPEDFYEFMKRHPELWDATKCDRTHFRQFDWFEKKREEDFKKMIDERWKGVN